ncbi:hypothetical protein [Methyloradius palustris]|uniref:Uncharacterized protein n=1 Tax=Methyloradius palustris TaxID=2778876 RepID=A0A8D5JYX1_9PROT|nr:hypothetical protein [Methyloradius palustris]BCM25107.1 hypothetical protein ZMTM_13660 [Methyloradius palustris]
MTLKILRTSPLPLGCCNIFAGVVPKDQSSVLSHLLAFSSEPKAIILAALTSESVGGVLGIIFEYLEQLRSSSVA